MTFAHELLITVFGMSATVAANAFVAVEWQPFSRRDWIWLALVNLSTVNALATTWPGT